MGSNGDMSPMLRNEAVVEPNSSKVVEIERGDGEQEGQRDEKEVLVVGEEVDEDEEGKRDVDSSASKRRSSEWSFFANRRLRVPSSRMVRSRMDSMMGAANRATIRALQSVPLKHKFSCLCRSLAETSLHTGDVLYHAVRTDSQRCRKMYRLMEEKYALEQEEKELKYKCDTGFEVSTQMKAGVDLVIQENQTLEIKNEKLQTSLEGEKDKVKMLEDKVKESPTVLGERDEGEEQG
ncbi:hypothetical protein Dimus_022255 [Dionaea muscipula]